MAGYVYESITDAQAASFGPNDSLFFSTAAGSTANQASQVRVAPFTSGSGSLSGTGITLTFNGTSHTFNDNISAASRAGRILFQDNSHLLIGTQSTTADNLTPGSLSSGTGNTGGGGSGSTGPVADPFTVYALSGNDTIDFSTAAGGVANYLNGGFGEDVINGGNANNHIYGNALGAAQGATQNGQSDAGDTITVGTGSNYINGNGGADEITVNGTATGKGFNRIFGGADDDTITINGNGLNQVNGNIGNDTIDASNAIGDNTLRGGQGDDTIMGGSRLGVLMGDVGNDTIMVHGSDGESPSTFQHINLITGGEGSDTFDFSEDGAGQAALFGQATYFQRVTDFDVNNDKFILNVGTDNTFENPAQVGTSSTTFASVSDAEVYANGQLAADGNNNQALVEVLNVTGRGTMLFYRDDSVVAVSGSQVAGLGVIQLDNVTASSITYDNFTAFAGTSGGTTGGTAAN